MTASTSIPMPNASDAKDALRTTDSPQIIERLATEMRVKSGGELPHAFCVEQVRRQLAGKAYETAPANDQPARHKTSQEASVFEAWALCDY